MNVAYFTFLIISKCSWAAEEAWFGGLLTSSLLLADDADDVVLLLSMNLQLSGAARKFQTMVVHCSSIWQ